MEEIKSIIYKQRLLLMSEIGKQFTNKHGSIPVVPLKSKHDMTLTKTAIRRRNNCYM